MKKIPDRLQEMIDEGVIDDVLTRLLSGKEASVFVVERDGHVCAAKVYKAREGRSFKNVASYVEGRNQTRNSRNKRAMQRKTKFGQELLENSWRESEHNALQAAFNAGVRVPEPYFLYEEVLLMELVVDEEGNPAPRLADFELSAEVASLLHHEAFLQVRRLLTGGLIHGDLSAFNILVAAEGLTLIDLPQIVDAAANSEAEEILVRDLRNVTDHLARFDPRLQRFQDCGRALWRHYQRGTLDEAMAPEEGGGGKRGSGRRRGPPGRKGQPKNDGQRGDGERGQRRDGERGQRRDGERGQRRDGERGQRRDGERGQRRDGERGQRRDGERGQRRDGERGQRRDGERGQRRDGERGQRRDGERGQRRDGERGQRRDGERGQRRDGERGQRRDGERGQRRDGERGQRRDGERGQRRDGERGDRARPGGGQRRRSSGRGPEIERIGSASSPRGPGAPGRADSDGSGRGPREQ